MILRLFLIIIMFIPHTFARTSAIIKIESGLMTFKHECKNLVATLDEYRNKLFQPIKLDLNCPEDL